MAACLKCYDCVTCSIFTCSGKSAVGGWWHTSFQRLLKHQEASLHCDKWRVPGATGGTEQYHHHHRNGRADKTFSNWNMLVPTSGLSLLNSMSCSTSSRFICWGNQMHGSILLAVESLTAQHRVFFFCRDLNYFPHCEELFSSSWNYQRNYTSIAESSQNKT